MVLHISDGNGNNMVMPLYIRNDCHSDHCQPSLILFGSLNFFLVYSDGEKLGLPSLKLFSKSLIWNRKAVQKSCCPCDLL